MSQVLTATHVNVFTRIRNYVLQTQDTPDEIVESIIADVTPEGYEQALRDILRRQIIVEMGLLRRSATATMATTKAHGKKREAIRAAFFNQRVDTQHGMKTIGTLTIEEVRWIAQKRYELAAATKEIGDKFTRLGNLMEEKQVAFVGQLDAAQVQDALT